MGIMDALFGANSDKCKKGEFPVRRKGQRPAVAPDRSGSRQFKRYALRVPVCVRWGAKEIWGDSTMLGMGGMFMSCERPLDANTHVTLEMELERGLGAQPFQVEGAVAYHNDVGMGIRFTGLSQADFQRLRNVMVYSVAAMVDSTHGDDMHP
ncbi:MAG: PilZ domain-containing protein [Nitrospirota bacterium]|nr:PilZ domain-containing protein [Nitrospirota bacterium]